VTTPIRFAPGGAFLVPIRVGADEVTVSVFWLPDGSVGIRPAESTQAPTVRAFKQAEFGAILALIYGQPLAFADPSPPLPDFCGQPVQAGAPAVMAVPHGAGAGAHSGRGGLGEAAELLQATAPGRKRSKKEKEEQFRAAYGGDQTPQEEISARKIEERVAAATAEPEEETQPEETEEQEVEETHVEQVDESPMARLCALVAADPPITGVLESRKGGVYHDSAFTRLLYGRNVALEQKEAGGDPKKFVATPPDEWPIGPPDTLDTYGVDAFCSILAEVNARRSTLGEVAPVNLAFAGGADAFRARVQQRFSEIAAVTRRSNNG